MPSYKLHYFNARGRGEIARLIFAVAGQEYEDNRMTREQWLEFKPNAPFGQMPLLEVDGMFIAQSNAIFRFLAKRFVLAGKTDMEAARADMIVDALGDLIAPLIKIHYSQNETEKEEMRTKFFGETLPVSLGHLEKLLVSNNGGDGYLVGDGLTWADIVFIDQISWISYAKGPEVPWDKAPKLKALKERVESLPKIAEWLQKRPQTDM